MEKVPGIVSDANHLEVCVCGTAAFRYTSKTLEKDDLRSEIILFLVASNEHKDWFVCTR